MSTSHILPNSILITKDPMEIIQNYPLYIAHYEHSYDTIDPDYHGYIDYDHPRFEQTYMVIIYDLYVVYGERSKEWMVDIYSRTKKYKYSRTKKYKKKSTNYELGGTATLEEASDACNDDAYGFLNDMCLNKYRTQDYFHRVIRPLFNFWLGRARERIISRELERERERIISRELERERERSVSRELERERERSVSRELERERERSVSSELERRRERIISREVHPDKIQRLLDYGVDLDDVAEIIDARLAYELSR